MHIKKSSSLEINRRHVLEMIEWNGERTQGGHSGECRLQLLRLWLDQAHSGTNQMTTIRNRNLKTGSCSGAERIDIDRVIV